MGMDWYTTALAMSDPYLRPTWVKVRWEVLDWLGREPGQHVVIVRYGRRHNIHDEWVYNGADIDGSKVLFARDLGAAENAKLVAHFAGRKVWVALIDGRRQPIRVGPYRGD
jgi:hypothetical protein